MIQRIQSVYLFLAALTMGVLFFHRIYIAGISGLSDEQLHSMDVLNDQILDIYDSGLLLGLGLFAIILSFINIFIFKNRKLQVTLSRTTLVTILIFIGTAIFLGYSDLKEYMAYARITPSIGLLLPILAILFIILATKGIKKDDKLVKSMDRLR